MTQAEIQRVEELLGSELTDWQRAWLESASNTSARARLVILRSCVPRPRWEAGA